MADAIINEKSANELAVTLVELLYQNQLLALQRTLDRFHVSERAYTILSDRDESVCLIYFEGKWKVYFSERGHESDCKITSEIEDACNSVLYRMSGDDEEYKQMQFLFSHELKELTGNRFSAADLYTAVRDGLRKISKTAAVL